MIKVLINFRVIRNYIILLIITRLNIQTKVKEIPYLLYIIDKLRSRVINIKTELLSINISREYIELTQFNIIKLRDYQIILRIL